MVAANWKTCPRPPKGTAGAGAGQPTPPLRDDGTGGPCSPEAEQPQSPCPPERVLTPSSVAPAAHAAHTALPSTDPPLHPAEAFLRGVLEGLLPESEASLTVAVAPDALDLPVATLFFCSQALHRLLASLEPAAALCRHPGDAGAPLPTLTARLRAHSIGRYTLTLADDGQFFRCRLPGASLDMEALTPLVGFVLKRQGSIRLARGRSTAFEIIG
ncbi:hypothetical protein GTA51_03705 [Desulfovibrio aerotolerans]|uniref:Uncharacterized protein n=1 Tax=Solidesulfovibrio aerotolerans TaxID=295255 RepID=A0A7C9IV29_9BACT|nr:hypothetical protein [Solidesulfovibrio aerotolerans]MYL82242.1 hypothetical protein [Solidesulfovibrio aerotolerans]